MKKITALLLSGVLLLAQAGCGNAAPASSIAPSAASEQEVFALPPDPAKVYDDFITAVDSGFAYDIAYELSTNPEFFNSRLGGRTAGSAAEHKAADYLVEQMNKIGLSSVEKQAADCDLWQFNGATFTVNGKEYDVYSYATASTPPEGITAEVIYLKQGTTWDYEGLDVKGKIVLIDIDQRADWWVTYPMLEAQLQGAAAILSANVGGFSQVSGDALNAQDICAPTGIPCLSIGLDDSRALQEQMKAGPVTARLVVDNVVGIDEGTTYNITGVLKGKSSEQQIIVGAHYDVHFTGFQDDSCAVGLVLAMAKAMIDVNYQPENDIVFCLHGAEEWGSSGTQYDWTVGAWEMINNLHPEWAGKTLAFLNFELPAYEFGRYTSTYSAPEMYKMLDYFANEYPLSPDPVGCFPDGVLTEGYQTYTYSDDFSYYAAGVPSMVNGFMLQRDMESVFDFYIDYYHTQYDTPETYNAAVMDFNIKYYGALALYIDQTPALPLDFTAQCDRLIASLDEAVLGAAQIDLTGYRAAVDSLRTASVAQNQKIAQINADYAAAQTRGDATQLAALRAEGKALTTQSLAAFTFAQKTLLGLMYERPIVPHQAPQENMAICTEIISLLEQGDVATAVDEYAWTVNNIFEWYTMYFSPEVIEIHNDMFWGEGNADNLYWGTGKTFTKAEVSEATRSLFARYDEKGGDFSKEIAIYRESISSQHKLLIRLIAQEQSSIEALTALLTA